MQSYEDISSKFTFIPLSDVTLLKFIYFAECKVTLHEDSSSYSTYYGWPFTLRCWTVIESYDYEDEETMLEYYVSSSRYCDNRLKMRKSCKRFRCDLFRVDADAKINTG